MKKFAFVLLLAAISTSRATTLLDYTYAGIHHSASPGIPISFANQFSVGSHDVEINSISFLLAGTAPYTYDFTGYVFSDNGGQPGTLLGSSHRAIGPSDLPGFYILGFYDFAFSTPITLSSGGSYWAGIGTSSAGGPPYIATTERLDYFVDRGITPSLLYAGGGYPTPGQMAVISMSQSLVYKLEGVVVPEPAGCLLLITFGIVQACCLRHRNAWHLATRQAHQPLRTADKQP